MINQKTSPLSAPEACTVLQVPQSSYWSLYVLRVLFVHGQ